MLGFNRFKYNSEQEIFDTVWKGFESQDWKYSFDDGVCYYRDFENNTKCAVGHLIPDEVYQGYIEGHVVFNPEMKNLIQKNNLFPKNMYNFVSKLQDLHDTAAMNTYKEESLEQQMRNFAVKYKLTISE